MTFRRTTMTPADIDTLKGRAAPLDMSAAAFRASMFVGDVVAGHGVTPFLAAAKKAGCSTANGVQMVEAVQEMMLDFMLGH